MKSAARGRMLATALLVLVLPGCTAILNPYVTTSDKKYVDDPSVENAFRFAEDTRNDYQAALRDYALMNRIIGITLIGAGAAATAVGITGGSTDVITGLAVGGAGLFGIDRLLYDENRLKIYAKSQEAVGCTINAFGELRSVQVLASRVGEGAENIRTILEDVPPEFEAETRVIQAKELQIRSWAALVSLRVSGARLYGAVETVRATANQAILNREPDLNEVVRNLRTTIPAYAGMIAELPSQEPVSTKAGVHESTLEKLAIASARLEPVLDQLEAVLESVDASTQESELEKCMLSGDVLASAFRTRPRNTVVIQLSDGEPKAEVIVEGGTPPYRAFWEGRTPRVTIGDVDYNRGGSKRGVVPLTAVSNADTGTFALVLSDDGDGRRKLDVIVERGQGGGGRGGAAPSARASDPKVKEIQELLIGLKCLVPATERGGTNADGVLGGRTVTALDEFARASGLEDAEGMKPGDAGFDAQKLIEQLTLAKESNLTCGSSGQGNDGSAGASTGDARAGEDTSTEPSG